MGQHFRTFASDLTPGWIAGADLAEDMITYINTNYGEDLVQTDVEITKYNSSTGSYQTTYFIAGPDIWFLDFMLSEGDGYIVTILNGKLDSQPLAYELPNSEIMTPVSIDLYNGQNFRGFPVPTATMAGADLSEAIIAYINANYAEDLTQTDIQITKYDSATESYMTTYFVPGPNIWFLDFSLNPGDGYIISILNGKLDSQPVTYIPS